MARGSFKQTASGLMILLMGNGLMKQGASLWDSSLRGRSLVDSHTFLGGRMGLESGIS